MVCVCVARSLADEKGAPAQAQSPELGERKQALPQAPNMARGVGHRQRVRCMCWSVRARTFVGVGVAAAT